MTKQSAQKVPLVRHSVRQIADRPACEAFGDAPSQLSLSAFCQTDCRPIADKSVSNFHFRTKKRGLLAQSLCYLQMLNEAMSNVTTV